MSLLTTAFSVGMLNLLEKSPRTSLVRGAGDRALFRSIMARVYVSDDTGGITAQKIALDAEIIGISRRSALRMCRSLVTSGLLTEKKQGRSKVLYSTAEMRRIWERQITVFTNELIASGYFDAVDQLSAIVTK